MSACAVGTFSLHLVSLKSEDVGVATNRRVVSTCRVTADVLAFPEESPVNVATCLTAFDRTPILKLSETKVM